jgi:serine/threonine-protein phosphatase 4 regulatory subunit 1
LSSIATVQETPLIKELQQTLPPFVHAGRSSSISLKAVIAHRKKDPPDDEDIKAIVGKLLDHFTGLAKVSTGDDNTDAEMRVYCAYSYPAVVLLLGPENWEGRLRDCFKTLLNPNFGSDQSNEAVAPPLPVKRCLASSLHTVAHILGHDITANDIMPIFRDHFLNDTDESVRLNTIRNFPTLASLLDGPLRSKYLLQWCETIRGEEVLGAMKRSATNPLVLNWRQRDYVSRSLPDLMIMVDALFAYNHLWPILKLVLTDAISLVRQDAIWTIPILLKTFAVENVIDADGGASQKAKELWSNGACQEVIGWLKDSILRLSTSSRKGSNGKSGNFSQRQLYCQVCTAMALAIRFGDGLNDPEDPVMELESKFASSLQSRNVRVTAEEYGAYRKLTTGERKHLLRLLINDILPLALEFKDDRVINVRLTLRKTLLLMPEEVCKIPGFNEAMQSLDEEVETWETFDGMETTLPPPPMQQPLKTNVPGVDMRHSNGMAPGSVDDVGDAGGVAQKVTKKKVSKRDSKKKGAENLQEQGNVVRIGMMADI